VVCRMFAAETRLVPDDVSASTLEAKLAGSREAEPPKGAFMLYAIAVVLLILWFHGLVGRRPL
jgi:hypothetical protein